MVEVVPLVTAPTLAIGVLAVVLIVGLLAYTLGGDDEWASAPRGAAGSTDAERICPRCHHRTPADADSLLGALAGLTVFVLFLVALRVLSSGTVGSGDWTE